MVDELSETVHCDDYRAHQSAHRRVGIGWVCDVCKSGAARDPGPLAATNAAPLEPTELHDWFAAPIREPDDPASD